ncbi:diaminobutyrate--2-oxoglutarate transaminase [Bacillus norwichensis]|uniref:Diaminobutyrate--2-oxoglutarate transaminase n=1 Tax=Bacillus norwichensis TaxID=2762217 RepID=A0ABR8VL77_9BACI|nr:diaminobutyrate--2-oxoglutarate transaminase [Bacillus norwichensis]MBD8005495.1 diaminobutyrate--2-oxoglutarate transaminase [Bacillus norwichensis]
MSTITDKPAIAMDVFELFESKVRSYSRSFPTVFKKAKNYKLWDINDKEYIDFFAGAGALNYGHNNKKMKKLLIHYLEEDAITHSLDMATVARGEFLQKFNEIILKPRNLDYKIMFPGPTGTNTVESALKIARKVTGRNTVISFTNGFHGMTIGSLSVTGNASKRNGAGIPLNNTVFMPFDNYVDNTSSIDYIKAFLKNSSSGVDLPAAIILETVQGEGGINAASYEWLRSIAKICREFDILLIIDDVQAGCGRTGTFFSFEPAEITPDIVCLSKSISGYGLPMALTLIKSDYDIWEPGEHNGTFRGNNLAFIAATEALKYWETNKFSQEIAQKAEMVTSFLDYIIHEYPKLNAEKRGRGLMQGAACENAEISELICQEAFKRGLLMETSGPVGEVFKFLPPLIIDQEGLEKGFHIVEDSIKAALNN